jgi:hypothetical protein
MAAKLTRMTDKIVALSGRELYHLQFSLQEASPETFWLRRRISSQISISLILPSLLTNSDPVLNNSIEQSMYIAP